MKFFLLCSVMAFLPAFAQSQPRADYWDEVCDAGCGASGTITGYTLSLPPPGTCRLTIEVAKKPASGGSCVGSCVNDVNECLTNNGGCAQICTNTDGSFVCSCNAGYTADGSNCNDIDECVADTDGCAQLCTNSVGSFACSCNSGYELDGDGKTCNDVNECATNNGGCDSTNGGCSNTAGSFTCTCNGGYVLNADGVTCDESDCISIWRFIRCTAPCGGGVEEFEISIDAVSMAGVCNNVKEMIQYPAGQPCNTQACDDVDECATNNGGCNHVCTNSIGSFTCSCNSAGYNLNADGLTCEDINECDTSNGGCGQVCTNSDGSFACSCNSGYALNVDGETCDDVNECDTSNGGCAHICTNSAGSFACSCNSGYALDGDGATCNDVNECNTNNGGCGQVCTNSAGSFTCSCNDGYELNADGETCDATVHESGGMKTNDDKMESYVYYTQEYCQEVSERLFLFSFLHILLFCHSFIWTCIYFDKKLGKI